MLTISGLKKFYYLPHFYDMRWGYARIMEVVKMSCHRAPYNGDVYFLLISYDDMSESEKESRKKDEQIGRLQDANDRQSESLRTMQKTLESIEEKLDASQKTIEQLHTQLSTQGSTLKSVESELKKSRREAEKYKSLYEVLKREKFSQTSQSSKYSRRSLGRDDEKDEWDGS